MRYCEQISLHINLDLDLDLVTEFCITTGQKVIFYACIAITTASISISHI